MGTRESIRFAYVSGPLMDYVTCVTRADNRTWRKNNNNSLWSSRALCLPSSSDSEGIPRIYIYTI